ncbi:MAG: SpoIIE family protein phosphatase [Clostridia bacterium]|nr:SpoIIE family protein phosphatase [Clostridia bacterium]
MQTGKARKTKYRKPTDEWVLSIVSFLLAVLLSRVRIHAYHAPFAAAVLYGAVMCNLSFPLTAAGVVAGCFLGAPAWDSALCAMLFTAAYALARLRENHLSDRFRTILFAGCCVLAVPICAVQGKTELIYGALCAPIALAGGVCMTHAFRTLGRFRRIRLLTEWDQNALLVAWGLCILGCSELSVGDVSFSMILILFSTMVLTRARGLYGSFVASLLSAAWVLYSKMDARIVAVVTLGAALSIPFYREGRIWIAASHFASALLLIGLQPEGLSAGLIWNTVASSVLLLLLPAPIIERIIALTAIDQTIQRNARASLLREQKRTADSLSEMSTLLKAVSDTFQREPSWQETTEEWTVQGALVICRNCVHQKICWKHADDMRITVMELAERLDRAEKVIPLDPIRPDCPAFSDVCGSVLLAFQQASLRCAVRAQLQRDARFTARELNGAGEAVDRLASQYRMPFGLDRSMEAAILKALLKGGFETNAVEVVREPDGRSIRVHLASYDPNTAGEIRKRVAEATGGRVRLITAEQTGEDVQLLLEPAPKWNVRMAVSQSAVDEAASGDSFGEKHSKGGRSLFALSDGMGTGKQANAESCGAIETLFRLYDSGMERELVYENVNRILMRGSREDSYATLDAVSFDLNTGTAELLKFGTPPSYLLRGKTLYALCGEALPCGIVDDVRPTVIRLDFVPEDVLLLMTDGVTDALAERTEAVLVANANRSDAADRILAAARETGYRDDQSVMVLRVRR